MLLIRSLMQPDFLRGTEAAGGGGENVVSEEAQESFEKAFGVPENPFKKRGRGGRSGSAGERFRAKGADRRSSADTSSEVASDATEARAARPPPQQQLEEGALGFYAEKKKRMLQEEQQEAAPAVPTETSAAAAAAAGVDLDGLQVHKDPYSANS